MKDIYIPVYPSQIKTFKDKADLLARCIKESMGLKISKFKRYDYLAEAIGHTQGHDRLIANSKRIAQADKCEPLVIFSDPAICSQIQSVFQSKYSQEVGSLVYEICKGMGLKTLEEIKYTNSNKSYFMPLSEPAKVFDKFKNTNSLFKVNGYDLNEKENTSIYSKNIISSGMRGSGNHTLSINNALNACTNNRSFYCLSMYDDINLRNEVSKLSIKNNREFCDINSQDTLEGSLQAGGLNIISTLFDVSYLDKVDTLINSLTIILEIEQKYTGDAPIIVLDIDSFKTISQSAKLSKLVEWISSSRVLFWIIESGLSASADPYEWLGKYSFKHAIFRNHAVDDLLVTTGYLSKKSSSEILTLEIGEAIFLSENAFIEHTSKKTTKAERLIELEFNPLADLEQDIKRS